MPDRFPGGRVAALTGTQGCLLHHREIPRALVPMRAKKPSSLSINHRKRSDKFVLHMQHGIVRSGSGSQRAQELRRGCPEPHSRRRESAQLFGQWARPQRRAATGTHLGSTTKVRGKRAPVAELESSANPQPGKAALRSARFPACGFWRLSSRQMVVLSRCAPPTARLEILLAARAGEKVAWSSCRGTANQRRSP